MRLSTPKSSPQNCRLPKSLKGCEKIKTLPKWLTEDRGEFFARESATEPLDEQVNL